MTQHSAGGSTGPKESSPLGATVLAALPDDPIHVEARGLLLERPDATVVLDGDHDDTAAHGHGFVFAAEHGMAIGFGSPGTALVHELRDVADEHGMVQEQLELHLPMSISDDWLALDEVASTGGHRVQALVDPSDHARITELISHEYAIIADRHDPLLETLPRALRAEFAAMRPWPMVVASLAGQGIASIASAFVQTEGYFDVSIDTVPAFRREGFGAACAAALIRVQAERGKAPVWMVREKNKPSLALSKRLGFVDVGRAEGAMLE